MPLTIFAVWPLFLLVIWLDERHTRKTNEARKGLAPVNLDKFDRLAAAMLANDPFDETDRLWCADHDITWPTVASSGSLPLPARPASHTSRNRLHRGF